MLDNIRRRPVGDHTIDDFNLPIEFLRRIADRIITASFEDRFRMVVRDAAATSPASQPQPPATHSDTPAHAKLDPSNPIRIIEHPLPDATLEYRKSLRETRPPLRGFAVPILQDVDRRWPIDPPGLDAPPKIRNAAEMVGKHLARDGLLFTLAQAIEILGRANLGGDDQANLQTLRSVGLPIDLIACFHWPQESPSPSIVRDILDRIDTGETAQSLRSALERMIFQFRPTRPGFGLASESGDYAIAAIRMQLTRGDYWEGPGDGGNIDLARQMIQKLPDVQFITSIERKFLDDFVLMAHGWHLERAGRLIVIPEELNVAQWAQDNGKPGFVTEGADRQPTVATIVPRYASRGDDGSTFVPGESFLVDGLTAAGQTIIHSPLLFQGGNIMVTRDPKSTQRVLLIGEAELHRNTALGLTGRQALEALRVEFGVDRCEVLPSVSFHIDFDLSIRAHDGRMIAFVDDVQAGANIVLRCGLNALETHHVIDAAVAKAARGSLDAGDARQCIETIGPIVFARSDGDGHFPLSLAEYFSAGPMDSGVGNFQRFLLAMDTMLSLTMRQDRLPDDPHARSYLAALARCEAERRKLHKKLSDMGFDMVAVPGLPNAKRGIVYVNGIQDRSRYIMPVYSGLYTPLDEAAAAVFRQALGTNVEIVPIHCSESQRRAGAVHCSCSAYPKP